MRIIGHRGARGEAPENTLGGFQYIQDLGIRGVEFDVRQLKDHALIVMHDDQMLRTTGQEKQLYECDATDLAQYNHAVTWSTWNQFEPTPLLQQTLKVIYNFDHIEVEVKAVASEQHAFQLTQTLQQQLRGFEQSAIITSFDPKIHTALQQQNSNFKRGLLIEDTRGAQAIEDALALGCCQIGWMNELATDELIQATHDAKLNISVWTVNEPERAKKLRDLGVQGLITDYPKLMLEQL
ncbi:glycerophosphodiester phosphodiesterase [Acinetobacter sp. B51(2017)]|uniref:glycerophosphodiester phosphodiesterase n=1 Tax=Acinetobacter sp. B51(2017) TaxID=2060938 RepID=UPI000F07A67E|nr:glycerophosphodiester phosphodiesterase [Acinetobacter sp. B51(2017)]